MKRIIVSLLLLGALSTSTAFAGKRTPQSPTTEAAPTQNITVSAFDTQSGDYVVICTAPEDGVGVLNIVDMDNNTVLLNQQVAVINGQYQYVSKKIIKRYWIHFHMMGQVAETTLVVQ